MKRLLLTVAGLVVAGIGTVTLAEATMTRHRPVDPATELAVTVEARTKGQTPYGRQQMTRSLFMICRLGTHEKVVAEGFEVIAPDVFRFSIQPALDAADQRQLHGCLEDASVDQLQLEVVEMEVTRPGPEATARRSK